MKNQKLIASLVGLLGLVALVAPAKAQYVQLNPSASLTTLLPVSSIGSVFGSATQVATTTVSTVGLPSPHPSGTLTSTVYSFSGGLIFDYTITNTDSVGSFASLLASDYTGLDTYVAYLGSSSGVNANNSTTTPAVSRTGGAGSTVTFNFATTTIDPGQNTVDLLIATNASKYSLNGVDLVYDGGPHLASPVYTPTLGAIPHGPLTAPEPSTVAAFGFVGLGLLGLAFRARRGKANLAM